MAYSHIGEFNNPVKTQFSYAVQVYVFACFVSGCAESAAGLPMIAEPIDRSEQFYDPGIVQEISLQVDQADLRRM